MADSSATVPTRIELIKAGTWPATSVKGPLTIMPSDLMEMKQNFDAGIGVPGGLGKLPIDYSHEEWAKAAGWIASLELGEDAEGTPTLFANVEWTGPGEQALKDGEYKCISPSFWPACLGEWYDPEDSEQTARNVLVGAGLTNIPFFKDLTAIMASRSSDSDGKSKNVIYIKADKEKTMTLDEVRVLDADKLNDEQKQFLIAHKEELSADEAEKFATVLTADAGTGDGDGAGDGTGTGDGDGTNDDDKGGDGAGEGVDADNKNKGAGMSQEEKDAAQLQADIKAGKKVVMDASEVNAMKTQIEAHSSQLAGYRRAEIKASVEKHLQRGAIKADQVDKWVDRIEKDASAEELLDGLNDNPIMASELGNGVAADVANAAVQFDQKVQEKIKASEGKLGYGEAVKLVASENPQLANDRQKQLTNVK